MDVITPKVDSLKVDATAKKEINPTDFAGSPSASDAELRGAALGGGANKPRTAQHCVVHIDLQCTTGNKKAAKAVAHVINKHMLMQGYFDPRRASSFTYDTEADWPEVPLAAMRELQTGYDGKPMLAGYFELWKVDPQFEKRDLVNAVLEGSPQGVNMHILTIYGDGEVERTVHEV